MSLSSISSVVRSDILKGLLVNFPSCTYCFAYGSAVFAQRNQKTGKMVDLIFVVDNPLKWHTENLRNNASHYSFLKYFGPKTLVKIEENWACRVYYNTMVRIDNQLIKYGIISTQTAINDLKHWDHAYVAGRLHKPVRDLHPPSSSQLVKYLKQNRLSALRAVLLQLPRCSTKFDLYHAITEISYIGDSRMAFGENPNKVHNIVSSNMTSFDEIYLPLIKELSSMVEETQNDVIIQDMSYETRLKHLMGLPFNLQRCLTRKSGKNPAHYDIEDVMVEISSHPTLGTLVRQSIADIVWKSSLRQTAQGVLTAGFSKAVRYGFEKVKKKVSSTAESSSSPSKVAPLRPNTLDVAVADKTELVKEKISKQEIKDFKEITVIHPENKDSKQPMTLHDKKAIPVPIKDNSGIDEHPQPPTFGDLPFGFKQPISEAIVTQTKGFITFTVKGQSHELLKPTPPKVPPVLVHKLVEPVPVVPSQTSVIVSNEKQTKTEKNPEGSVLPPSTTSPLSPSPPTKSTVASTSKKPSVKQQ